MQNIVQIDSTHPVVSRLIEIQGKESDRTFSAAKLSVSETVWYRIKNGKYQADDHSRVLRKLTSDLSGIIDGEALTGSIKASRTLPLSYIIDARDALNMAFAEERNRLVIILADTGGGKTTIAKSIERDFSSRTAMVEATETWRNSYLAGLHDVSRSCGIPDPKNNSRLAQHELITELRQSPRIITIDEGNYFGAACLNLVKSILNQTRSIVVILAMPKLWNTITYARNEEARQLRNRAAAILEFNKVKLADVRLAMQAAVPDWPSLNGAAEAAAKAVAAAANAFGLWNTVFSVADFIIQEAGHGSLTLDIVQKAADDVQKLRR